MEVGPIGELTAREVEALRGAAVWYAKYHSSRVSERVGDRAASASRSVRSTPTCSRPSASSAFTCVRQMTI